MGEDCTLFINKSSPRLSPQLGTGFAVSEIRERTLSLNKIPSTLMLVWQPYQLFLRSDASLSAGCNGYTSVELAVGEHGNVLPARIDNTEGKPTRKKIRP
ncbi:MAG TPA: hypothetical protein PLV84_07665 [Deltaproteobacteria bacterium]|nr:hypothetical protein [Deltaproteobacteria bacterium]